MRNYYYFKDSVDYIDKDILRKESYQNFINELTELNQKYKYSIYLFGSYIDYLIERKEYNDIDFIILSQKLMEIDELTEFFKKFHQLCKKYNIVYNMMYSTDKNKEDFNDIDQYSCYVFKTGESRVIRLYQKIENKEYKSMPFLPLPNSDLFEGILNSGVSQKAIDKMQKGVKFNYPIKIQ